MLKTGLFTFIIFYLLYINLVLADSELAIIDVSNPQELLNHPSPILDFHSLPSTLVHGVNIITGDYQESCTDLTLPGFNPFSLVRYYTSANCFKGNLMDGWNINHGAKLLFNRRSKHDYAIVKGSGIGFLLYKSYKRDRCYRLDSKCLQLGLTNCCKGVLSGRTHLENHELIQEGNSSTLALLNTGDGTEHTFWANPKDPDDSEKHHIRAFLLHKSTDAYGRCLRYGYNEELGLVKYIKAFDRIDRPMHLIEINPALTEDAFKQKCSFTYFGNNNHCVAYKFKKIYGHHAHYVLEEVTPSQGPWSKYYYTTGEKYDKYSTRISRVEKPDNRFLKIDYCKGLVSRLIEPAGPDNAPVATYQFTYGELENSTKFTDVINAIGYKIRYEVSPTNKLHAINRYRGKKSYRHYSREEYYWDGINLSFKLLRDHGNVIQAARVYYYDEYGNVKSEALFGNLTGAAAPVQFEHTEGKFQIKGERYEKKYEYDSSGNVLTGGKNLLKKEQDQDVTYLFEYHEGSDLIAAKYTKYKDPHEDQERIHQRHFYFYNALGALIREIQDDGSVGSNFSHDNLTDVTERKITSIDYIEPSGFPEIVTEVYLAPNTRKEIFLKKYINHYNEKGWIVRQDHYDNLFADNIDNPLYSLHWTYDSHGNIAAETDELGFTTKYTYDQNDNCIQQEGPGEKYVKTMTYDHMNRLIDEEERWENGYRHLQYRYDNIGRKIASIDEYGNATNYLYDEFGRLIKKSYPVVNDALGNIIHPFVEKSYDIFGNVTQVIDENRNVTSAGYHIRGKPIWIKYPDGSKETFSYTIKGELSKKIRKDGSYEIYSYDPLSRPVKVEEYNPSHQRIRYTQTTYNAFHKLTETDVMGHVTKYTYDGAGRLAKMEKGDNKTTYHYDKQGFEKEVRQYYGDEELDYIATIKTYDFKGQILEEIEQEGRGTLLSKVEYGYNAEGKCCEVKKHTQAGISKISTKYNPLGQPLSITDALKHRTNYEYDMHYHNENGIRVARELCMDPKGTTKETIYDASKRIAQVKTISSKGNLVSHVKYGYDAAGNQVSAEQCVLAKNGVFKIRFEYDALNRLKQTIEAEDTPEQKVTKHIYDLTGRLEKIIKPDQVEIVHIYNYLGHLSEHFASDGSFHYLLKHDLNGNTTLIQDLLHTTQNERRYDDNDHLKYEKLGNGLVLTYTFDGLGRLKSVQFPDQTAISYTYVGRHIETVARVSSKGEMLYKHCYTNRDLSHHVTEMQLLGNAGHVTYTYDLLERPTNIEHPVWSETSLTYALAGQLESRHITDSIGKIPCTYTYDENYQLASEQSHTSHTFVNDSLYNHLRKDNVDQKVNRLNALIQDAYTSYGHDFNGNLTSKKSDSQEIFYTYDALNRLIEVNDGLCRYCYDYDAFHRRLTRRTLVPSSTGWLEQDVVKYLWQGQKEIGAVSNDKITELRILGEGIKADIGATVAIELQQQVYVPLHDHIGNIVCLLDTQGNAYQSYRYSAYGEEEIFDASVEATTSLNPWRYSSKRTDLETGFVYYGRRYYDPLQFRWLTPDPAGFIDGLNLYAFLKNNPYRYIDPDGRFGFVIAFPIGATIGEILAAAWTAIEVGIITAAVSYGGWKAGECINQNITTEEAPTEEKERKENDKRKKSRPDHLKPDENAEGEHTTFKRDPNTGKITHYEEWKPQTNPYDPKAWESVKRYDGPKSGGHYNKDTDQYVPTPHIHDPTIPGGVRPANLIEIPTK